MRARFSSYRELPQTWYHFSTKERDEPRPRGGLLRVREFIMKDSYSFDRDEAGLDVSFERHKEAYERMLERCWVEAYLVEAESGIMGGTESLGFLAPTGLGRERADALRERRLLRRHRGRSRHPAPGRVPRAVGGSGGHRDAGRDDDRGARRACSASTPQRRRRRCRSSSATVWCSRSCAATTG